MKAEIENRLNSWVTESVMGGKSVNDILQVDGIPLWWAFNRLINILPRPFLSFQQLCDTFTNRSTPLRSRLKFALIKRAFSANERLKWHPRKRQVFSSKEKIIFLTYSNHMLHEHGKQKFYRTDAVIKKLHDIEPFILVVHPVGTKRSTVGLPTIYDFITREVKKKARTVAAELAREWKHITKGDKERILTLNTRSIFPYIRPHLDFLFSRQFLFIFLTYYFTIKDSIAANNVRGIYLTASVGIFEKCCIMAAKVLNIPVYIAQHGSGVNFANIHPGLLEPITFFVFGSKHKELLLATGIKEEKIVVTGSPMNDELASLVPGKSKQLKRILIITQPFVEDNLWTKQQRTTFFTTIHTLMRMFTQEFAIKIHPREDPEIYAKEFPGIPIISKHLFDEIVKSDLIIGVSSTALMEALLLNRPVLVLDMFNRAENESHVISGLSRRITGKSDAVQEREYYLKFYRSREFDIKREKYIEMYFNKLDGKAADRIVRVMKRL